MWHRVFGVNALTRCYSNLTCCNCHWRKKDLCSSKMSSRKRAFLPSSDPQFLLNLLDEDSCDESESDLYSDSDDEELLSSPRSPANATSSFQNYPTHSSSCSRSIFPTSYSQSRGISQSFTLTSSLPSYSLPLLSSQSYSQSVTTASSSTTQSCSFCNSSLTSPSTTI